MKKFNVLLILAVFSSPVFAQLPEWLYLRASSSDMNALEKPATIQYTNAQDGDNSYSIDAALGFTFENELAGAEISAVFESHKNTLTKKEQDAQSLKLVGNYLLERSCNDCVDIFEFQGTLEYQLDNLESNESILGYLEVVGSSDKINLNSYGDDELLPWYWSPIIGIEYEDFIKSNADKEGKLFRTYTGIELGFYPFFNKDDHRWEISASFKTWNDFNKDSAMQIAEDNHKPRQIGIKYSLTPQKSDIGVLISLDWLKGENPRTKLLNQEYVQIGLGIKI